jgi:phosphatidylserine decarboxylase
VGKVDRLFLGLWKVLPTNLLSRLTGFLARVPLPFPLNVLFLRTYAALFRVNLKEAEFPLSRYHTLQAFFTRRLKAGVRAVEADRKSIVAPVDGTFLQRQSVSSGTLLQVKGWRYSLRDLLGDPKQASLFLGGTACTIYLSPADYHRIHMPLEGTVECLHYLPGRLFPVNRFSLTRVRNLFLLNERVILHLKTGAGNVAMVLVGATNVGKIRVCFDDIRRRFSRSGAFQRTYTREIFLPKGEEVGCFELGSTVILLFEKGQVTLTAEEGEKARMGGAIGFIS